ncbi:MAG: 2,3-bisphosphoglycerate-dependent phosphoglycerate mutase [Vicingaceae bacterium]|jgi:2,3-bisphosphoglycerate-dependent phosphoglycerate mutase
MGKGSRLVNHVIVAVSIFICSVGWAQEPENKTGKNTVFEQDMVTGIVGDTVLRTHTLTIVDTLAIGNNITDTATTFIVLRHAEKQSTGANPTLSAAGKIRANKLRDLLVNVSLDAIYSTDYNRTKQTVQPTAAAKMLAVSLYNPSSLNPLVDLVLNTFHDGTILVVGHSNTTPSFLNVLTGTKFYSNILESEYDNLYIVTVFQKGRVEVVHFRY